MKKRGIKAKVTRLASLLSIGSIVLISLVSIIGIINMRANTVRISDNLGSEAATGSEAALESQALSQLQSLTRSKTDYADARMQAVITQNTIISNLAQDIFNHPSKYNEQETQRPLAENKGKLSAQILYAEGLDMDKVREEAGKVANLNNVLMQSTGANSSVITSQIGVESGFIIMGDYSADTKVNMEYLDPRERSWYKKAKDAGTLVWSDVVDDAFDRGLGIVCANPVYDNQGNLRGVVGVSALLTELNHTIASEELGDTSYAFALDARGQMIISPNMKKLEDGINMLESDIPETRALAEKMVAGESGVTRLNLNGTDVYAAYAPMELLPWSICTVVGVDEILAPAHLTASTITEMTDEANTDIDGIILIMLIFVAAVVVISVVGTYLISNAFSRKITDPIEHLSLSIGSIKDKNLKYESDIKTGDEIEELSAAFEKMSYELVLHIKNLTAVTAEKERIGAELNVATSIQASMLPCIFPAFPDRREFDIFASMQPAKEVGGDFYDFFLVDENTLAIVMADVSGKGVPAALFMVIAKTLIKNNAQYGKNPKDVFETVNNLLCENNEAGMFVTAFMGYLDIPSGRFAYVNAGHNPPLLRCDGQFQWLNTKAGFVLAGMEDMFYKQNEITLHPGDELFLYTDGVTEAVNNEKELFTDPRLLETANMDPDLPLREFTISIKREIDKFAEGAEQADDITMLALRYKGLEG